MPRTPTTKAAEPHENAAKSHRTAAEHHGKGDHAKGREKSGKAEPLEDRSRTFRDGAWQEPSAEVAGGSRGGPGASPISRRLSVRERRMTENSSAPKFRTTSTRRCVRSRSCIPIIAAETTTPTARREAITAPNGVDPRLFAPSVHRGGMDSRQFDCERFGGWSRSTNRPFRGYRARQPVLAIRRHTRARRSKACGRTQRASRKLDARTGDIPSEHKMAKVIQFLEELRRESPRVPRPG